MYTCNLNSKKKTQLTKGDCEVRNVSLWKDKTTFYLTTNSTHPGNRDFYKLNLSNKILQLILTKDGAHQVSLSPDESTLNGACHVSLSKLMVLKKPILG